jgi:hypothetical protein
MSSIFATTPTLAYRPSTRGTVRRSASSPSAVAPRAARASSDSIVSVTTIPGRTTPVVRGSRGKAWMSSSFISVSFPLLMQERATPPMIFQGRNGDYLIARLLPASVR